MDRRVEPARSDNFAKVSSSIAERIRGVCADWPEPEFEALVRHMTAIEIKFALRVDLQFLSIDALSENDSSHWDKSGATAAKTHTQRQSVG
jgi:hypothetical protein